MQTGIRVLFSIPTDQADDLSQPHNRILAIGGKLCHQPWTLSQADAISAIERNQLRFWVSFKGEHTPLIVADWDGHRYLKAELDGDQPDSLLLLVEASRIYQSDGI